MGGAANLMSTVMGAGLGIEEAQRERDWNEQQAQINRDFQREERLATQDYNVDMWNMQNEYNSPAAQLERAKAAGINPNSLFGQSSVVGNAMSTPSSTPMSGSQASYNSGMSPALTAAGAQFGKNTADMIDTLSASRLKNQEERWNKDTWNMRQEVISTNIRKNNAEIQGIMAKAGVDKANEQLIRKTLSWTDKLNQAQIDEALLRMNKLRTDNWAVVQQVLRENKVADQNIAESKSRENINAIDYQQKQLDYAEDAANAQARVDLEKQQLTLKQELSKITGLPLGTEEFEATYKMWFTGELDNYIDKCLIPTEQARWKPRDWTIDDYSIAGRSTRYYFGDFNVKRGYVNYSLFPSAAERKAKHYAAAREGRVKAKR